MRRVLFAIALLGACATSAAPRPARKGQQAPRARGAPSGGAGQVRSVTTLAAFLDRGAADGLKEGQRLTFTRGGRAAGECVVESVSERFARCAGGGLRVGDRFAVARVEAPAPPLPEPLPSDAELEARAQRLARAEWALVTSAGAPAEPRGVGPRAEAWLTHVTSAHTGWALGPWQQQRVDVRLDELELWRGLRVSADATVLHFTRRPPDTRSAYPQVPVLLVHRLELGFRRADVPFSAAIGRTWLRGTPGLLVVDGGQAAWRFGDDVELGAYGGLLPEAARLTILPSQWAAGAFGRVRHAAGTGASATLVQLSARGGYAVRAGLGGRAEVALQGSLWRGANLDAHAAVELGFGQAQAAAGIDAVRLDVGARPIEALRVHGALRYRGLPLSGLAEVGTVSPGQRALHADLGALWAPATWLLVGLQAGLATDFDAGLTQARVGPELTVPTLFGGRASLGLGYVEEFGWLRGRHGWLQASVGAPGKVRVLTRVSWFQQQHQAGSEGLTGHEAGLSAALEASPWAFLRARVFVSGRVPLGEPAPVLGSVGAQLGGAF